jgi:hypothetical protein
MEVSSCCGAPIVVERWSDLPHVTDDEYDLKVPVWVCSLCGQLVGEQNLPRGPTPPARF